jgi:hypothetical protein
MADQLDQPMLHWQHRNMRALRAQIAGDNGASRHWTRLGCVPAGEGLSPPCHHSDVPADGGAAVVDLVTAHFERLPQSLAHCVYSATSGRRTPLTRDQRQP